MLRNVQATALRVHRDSITANQTKLKARKIRLFRNGDAFYKVSCSSKCVRAVCDVRLGKAQALA